MWRSADRAAGAAWSTSWCCAGSSSPAVVPTVWVLQSLGLFKTLTGLIFIEIAFGLAFCTLLFQAFISAIPRDLDEAAIIDGAGRSGCSSR